MSDYIVTNTELTETADAIRAKTGDSAAIEWESGTGFADAVAAIPTGGGSHVASGEYIASGYVVNVTITHNLGSRKIVFIQQRLNEDTSVVVEGQNSRYLTLGAVFLTTEATDFDQTQWYKFQENPAWAMSRNSSPDVVPVGVFSYFGTTNGLAPQESSLAYVEAINENQININFRYGLITGRIVWRAYALD